MERRKRKAPPAKRKKRKKIRYTDKLLPFNLAAGVLAILNSLFCLIFFLGLFVSEILPSGAISVALTICFTLAMIASIIGLHYNLQYKLSATGHILIIVASVMMLLFPAYLFLPALVLYMVGAFMNLKKVKRPIISKKRLQHFYQNPFIDVFIVLTLIFGGLMAYGLNNLFGSENASDETSQSSQVASSTNQTSVEIAGNYNSESSDFTETSDSFDSTEISDEGTSENPDEEAIENSVVPVFQSFDGPEFRIAVTEIRTERNINESEELSYTADEGTKYLIVNLNVTNLSQAVGVISISDFTILDANGATYAPTTLIGLSSNISFDAMEPETERGGYLIYIVPESLEITGLQLHYISSSPTAAQDTLFALS